MHYWIIRILSRLVPGRFRIEWTREWEAELRHRESLASEWRRPRRKTQWELFRRSAGAFRDVLALQPRRLEDEMFHDLRYGVRMLLQNKGWTAVIVLSLVFGIGANTALFSEVDSLFLQSIPVQDPDGLVRLAHRGKNDMGTDISDYGPRTKTAAGDSVQSTFPYATYLSFLKNNQTMTDLLACAPKGQLNVVVDGHADIARGFVASGNFYQVLGVPAILGRTILPDDDQPAAAAVAVISEGFWKSRFGGIPDIVGKSIRVNNTPVTIVGVIPAGFTGVQQASGTAPDLTLPLSTDPRLDNSPELVSPTYWWLQVMGRLKAGATAKQVQDNLDGVLEEAARAGWQSYFAGLSAREQSMSRNQGRTESPHLVVDSGSHGIYDANPDASRGVAILSVVVGILLLIVCANVANLLLSRAVSRQKEISVRLSMGATRSRLVRQLLTESILLSGIGGAGGLLVGYWGRLLLPDAANAAPYNWRLFAFVSALTLLTGVISGTAPAWRAASANVNEALKESGRSVIRSTAILSKSLLVVQVAMSLTLLIGAGLFLVTLKNLHRVDVGFNPNNLLMFRVNPQLNGYDQARSIALYSRLLERLRTVPGVEEVSLSQPALLSGSISSSGVFIAGHSYSNPHGDQFNQMRISPEFFQTLGIPLLAGRTFNEHDDANGPKVAIINQAAVRKYFAREDPLGHHFGMQLETPGEFEIVGVVGDAKYNSLRDAVSPTVYFSLPQRFTATVTFELRTAPPPSSLTAAVREAVREADPNLPLLKVTTQTEQIEERVVQEKLFAESFVLFATLALLLASIGLFGLMSYNVGRRTGEIGVRMALGAERQDVLSLVMKESMILVGVGFGIGLALTLAMGWLIQSLLFGLAPSDPVTIILAAIVLAGVAGAAAYLPARRASRVDPMTALRYE